MALLGPNGEPLPKPRKSEMMEELAAPAMGSVRSIHASHPADGLTPARLAALLREAETGDATAFLEIAEQMEEKELHYAAVLGVRKRAIRGLKLVVESTGEDSASEDAAALVREVLSSSAVKDDLIDMLDALGKGYSVTELIWDVRKSPWTIVDLRHRDPRWFRFDQEDGRTLQLRSNSGDVPLAPFKFVDHRARLKSGLPIRSGLARLVAWAYVFKNYTVKDWQIFMEAFGHPVRIGRYGPGATEQDKATLLRAVRRIGTDMAAIIPKSMEVELASGAVTGGEKMFEGSARWWDEQISKAVLGQVSTTDAIAGGHAVGRVHNQVRDDIRDADAEQLAATLMRDVAAPLTRLNFASASCPNIRFEAKEDRDPRLVLAAIKMFGPEGLEIAERTVRDMFGLREPEEGEAVLRFARAAPPSDMPAPEALTASIQKLLASRAIEDGAGAVLESGRGQAQMDIMLGGLLESIDQATSLADVRDILSTAADDAPDETLRELIARLTFSARLAGEAGADIT